jgi:hypothetical protein
MQSIVRVVFTAASFLLCVVAGFGQQRSARDYYRELYDAGGLFSLVHTTEGTTFPVKVQSHVCIQLI